MLFFSQPFPPTSDHPPTIPVRPPYSMTLPEAQPNTLRRSKAHILMSIKKEHITNIASGRKNHEYRKYLLPPSVRHIWFYTSAPVSSIQYVARIGPGRKPGEVPEDGGIGNDDFNAGRKISKFGYEIKRLYRLRKPITLKNAISTGYLKAPPQKYCWAPAFLLHVYPLNEQDCIMRRELKCQENVGKKAVLVERLDNHPLDVHDCVTKPRAKCEQNIRKKGILVERLRNHPLNVQKSVIQRAVKCDGNIRNTSILGKRPREDFETNVEDAWKGKENDAFTENTVNVET